MGRQGNGEDWRRAQMSGVLPKVYLVRHGETAWTVSRQHTGRTDIPRADRVVGRVRAGGGNVLLFAHREILRMAMRWIGLAPTEGRGLLLATASLSVLGYDHDATEAVIHAWNGRDATVGLA
jgi:broad specificity phosphatase PhoE